MTSRESSKLELVVSNYVRNDYEKKCNQQHVPMALKYIMLKYSKKIIGCGLLTIKEDLDLFEALDELLNIKRFQLLFKASDHDYSEDKFHKLCDNKGATVTIIQSDYGNIFGGYTSKSWTSNCEWVKDQSSFLFLVKSDKESIQRNCPLIFPIKKDEKDAIWCDDDSGPLFGAGDDLAIEFDGHKRCIIANHYTYDYGEFYEKVKLPGGDCGDDYDYTLKEYEVFQVQ